MMLQKVNAQIPVKFIIVITIIVKIYYSYISTVILICIMNMIIKEYLLIFNITSYCTQKL